MTDVDAHDPEDQAADEAAPAAPGIGHNALTEDEEQALALQFKRQMDTLDAELEEAKDEVKSVRTSIKTLKAKIKQELGKDGVDLIADMQMLATEAGEAQMAAVIERQKRASRFMGATLGAQLGLFDTSEPDRTPIDDRAYMMGKVTAMDAMPAHPPHDPSTSAYRRWMEGWHDGAAVLTSLQKKQDAAAFEEDEQEELPEDGASYTEKGDVPTEDDEAAAPSEEDQSVDLNEDDE